MQRLKYGWIVALLLVFANPSYAQQDKDVLVFGIVPQQSAGKLLKAWGPVLKHIEKQVGKKIRFATAPTIGEFENRCLKGQYDLAYMNPYHYVRFAKQPGYYVLANQSNKKLTGVFVVAKDSSAKQLSDLDSMTLHFPSPNAFAASLLPQAELRAAGVNYKPHSVYRNVARGVAKAGGGIVRTFNAQGKTTSDKLTILKKTKGYTPHAIAAHPRVNKTLAQKVTQALLNLPDELRKPLKFKPLKASTDAEYNDIRALNIDTMLGGNR